MLRNNAKVFGTLIFKHKKIRGGTLKFKVDDDGIYAGGAIAIKNGTLTIDAEGDGIDAESEDTATIISGGTLTITAGDEGIEAEQDVTVKGGALTIKADNDCVDADGNITINGGDLELTANSSGLECGYEDAPRTLTINGGSSGNTTTKTEKNKDGSITKTTTNKSTGTITETTTHTDGSTTKVETKKDGTVTTTEMDSDGNTTITIQNPDGTTTTEETKTDGTTVKTETAASGETTAEVKANGETEVVIPVENAAEVEKVVVTDKSGKETEVYFEIKDGGVKISVSGDCTVAVVGGSVSGGASAKKEFVDVHPVNHWATTDVDYAYTNGLMIGTSETHFSSDAALTRAMIVTILYRAEGEPATNRSIPFADIDMGAYYANAVVWAQQNGIVKGISETEFAPDDNITREQIAAIMYRYAIYKGMNAVTMEENLHFGDANEISEYAVSAMNWAVGSGLIKGRAENVLAPKDCATRAESAAMLHRFTESNK